MRAKITALTMAVAAALCGGAAARDFGIFVDGAYGRGETDMNNLVDRRVDRAKMIFDARNNDADDSSARVDSEDALEAALCGIMPPCGAGDSLTIVMMGHGNRDRFSFSLGSGEDRRLTAAELTAWIRKAATDECCIRVVIFACHAGSWIDDLFEHPGMKAVYCSSRAGERSYSDAVFGADGTFQDNGDWMDAFNHDWAAAAGVADGGDAMEQATYSAWSDMPEEFGGRQHPTGWRRGAHEVRAHVVSRFGPRSRTARLHFYDPPFMRCQTQTVNIDRPGAVPGQRWDACSWVTTTVKFGRPREDGRPRDPLVMCDPPAAGTAPSEKIIGHVTGDGRVHIIKPNWYSCRQVRLGRANGVSVDPRVRACTWINPMVQITNASGAMTATSDITPFNYTPSVTAHVERVRGHRRAGNLCIRIQRPSYLRFLNGPVYVTVPPADLQGLDRCDIVRLDLQLTQNGDNMYTGGNVTELQRNQRGARNFDSGVDDATGPGFDVPTGEPFCPTVEIRNAGLEDNSGSDITVQILDAAQSPVHSETVAIDPLPVDASQTVKFNPVAVTTPGDYTALFTTAMGGDENPHNNELRVPFTVADPDPSAPPPAGWRTVLVGDFIVQPNSEANENVLCLEPFGPGFNNPPLGDSTSFAFQELTPDFFVACGLNVPDIGPGQAAGMMVRHDPIDAQSPFAAVVVQGGNAQFIARVNPGGNVQPFGGGPVAAGPVFVGLGSNGNEIFAEISPDGVQWDPLGVPAAFPGLPEVLHAGPFASSAAPATNPMKFFGIAGFAFGTEQPPTPTDLVATALSSDTVQLVWKDNSVAEFGFDIECTAAGDPVPIILQAPPDTVEFTHSGLDPATVYTYRVRALTSFEHEEWSPPASAETHGAGLEAWVADNGAGDPFAAQPDGTPGAYHYFTGAPANIILPPFAGGLNTGEPGFPLIIDITKPPGVHDIDATLQMLVPDPTGSLFWEPLYVLPGSSLPRQYSLLIPPDAGVGLLRLHLQSVVLDPFE